MKFQIIKHCSIDIDAERKRLKQLFKGAQRKRLEAILNAFVDRDSKKYCSLCNALPRDKQQGCSETEFLPLFMQDFFQELIGTPHLKDLNEWNNMLVEKIEVKYENE